jgi:hypothetical protein
MQPISTKPVRCTLWLVALWSLAWAASAWAQGGVSFLARRDYRVGTDPRSMVVGDFNGDGHPDAAVVNAGAYPQPGTVSILLGRGDGSFVTAPVVRLRVGAHPRDVASGSGITGAMVSSGPTAAMRAGAAGAPHV